MPSSSGPIGPFKSDTKCQMVLQNKCLQYFKTCLSLYYFSVVSLCCLYFVRFVSLVFFYTVAWSITLLEDTWLAVFVVEFLFNMA